MKDMNSNHSYTSYIGLTGRMGSGKGEVVKILEQQGYQYISLSDIVREEVAGTSDNPATVTREQMQNTGNRLRREGGAGVLGKRVREKVSLAPGRWVIDGIRNPAEIKELRQLDRFRLVAVEAEINLILQRIKDRKRSTDLTDEQELRQRLDREWGIGEPEDGQQVGQCMAMADTTINNNGPLRQLQADVLVLLATVDSGKKNSEKITSAQT